MIGGWDREREKVGNGRDGEMYNNMCVSLNLTHYALK